MILGVRNQPQRRSSLIGSLVFFVAMSVSGCNLLGKLDFQPGPAPSPSPDDKQPDDGKEPDAPKAPESEYWSSLAKLVESGRFDNSDQIVLTVDALKSAGVLSDLSRVDSLRQKRVDVEDENRMSIAETIRGK